ncbi:MAG: hypothetical protein Salg2KO_22050 [Salibacteraceae bacterium]
MLGLAHSGMSQEALSGPLKKRLYQADQLFELEEYIRAYHIYDSLWDLRPNDVYLQYKTGASSVYRATGRDEAYDILKDLRGSKVFPRATFYMARAKHFKYQFDEAIRLYNEYLQQSGASGAERIETLRLIENCENGIDLMERKLALTLEILTPPSNEKNSQYSPVISPDGKNLYYTNRGPDSKGELMTNQTKSSDIGQFYEDIFVAKHEGGDDQFNFGEGKGISDTINKSDRHEAPMSVSYDNKIMFIYLSGEKVEEDIYISYNLGDTAWSKPEKLEGKVNTPQYEGHAFLAPDNRTLYFSSDKPGGFGGRDIWIATLGADSTFTNVRNAGPKINTEFNEDSPFMYSNGSSFYFASESHGSMGGYDMFYIKYDSTAGDWQEAINLGYPINTTDDDRFYYITKDGDWGYFSSARASGENLHDIYRIQPGTFERLNALVLLIGTVYVDDVPNTSIAKIMDDKTGDVLASLVGDSTTGEFFYSLIPGHKYKISLLVDGFAPKYEYVDVPVMQEGVLRIEHRFDFYTDGFVKAGDLQNELDSLMKTGESLSSVCDVGPDREELTEAEIASGCYFRVQVGAYRNPGRVDYQFLRGLDEVEIKGYEDGITRFLMAPKFTKRSEADKLRMKCIAAGEWDSWITVRR